MALAGLVAVLAAATLAAQRRGAERIAARAQLLETGRIVEVVLGEELRTSAWGRDHGAPEGDSIRLRGFRGVALVCTGPGAGSDSASIHVRYSGMRLPEPRKDSVLILGPDLRWRAVALRSRASVESGCVGTAGGPVERWAFDRAPGPVVLARVFETGVYLLQDRALRYRRGAGGRQPLTPELIDDGASTLTGSPGTPVRLQLRVRGAGAQGPELRQETGFWPLERAP